MGLLWDSSRKAEPVQAAPVPTSPPAEEPTQTPEPSQAQSPKYKKALSRDELAEKELRDMLAEIAEADKPIEPKYRRNAVLPSNTTPASRDDLSLTLEDSLYPSTMSCREAFDSAFYCQSLGGQFNALYRYGGIQSCSEHWKSFWFCMRTKSYPDEQRENMIRDHYKKKDLKYKLGPSSEDVWEGREQKVDWGTAFRESVEQLMPGESDQEWNKRESARRRGRAAGTI